MSKKKNIGFHYWQPNIEGIIAYVDVPGTATVSRVTLTLGIVLSTSRFGPKSHDPASYPEHSAVWFHYDRVCRFFPIRTTAVKLL